MNSNFKKAVEKSNAVANTTPAAPSTVPVIQPSGCQCNGKCSFCRCARSGKRE